jgi:hypothetical protein
MMREDAGNSQNQTAYAGLSVLSAFALAAGLMEIHHTLACFENIPNIYN